MLGAKVARTPIIVAVTGIVGVVFFGITSRNAPLDISFSWLTAAFFVVFVALSFVWNFIFDFLLGTIGFWFENPWVVFMVKERITALLCGLLVPIDLFPSGLQQALRFFPFKFYVFFPYKVLIGEISPHECWLNLLLFLVWIGGMSLITLIVWTRSIKNYTAVGG
jgi:ABC-2 type transport system permease protein